MSLSQNTQRPTENRILASLPADEYERLQPYFEEVKLHIGEILSYPGEKIEYVYFPLQSTVSVVALTEDGTQCEVGVVGNEGMFGLPIVLGTETAPLQAIVQVADGAIRMKADSFRAEVGSCPKLYKNLLRYAQAFYVQTAQAAACNRLHHIDDRLARWLLMCQDRAKSSDLELTHEFMATMLGVRRAGISEAAKRLQDEKLIEYRRGRVHILDRRGLEEYSCECYGIVRREYERLLS